MPWKETNVVDARIQLVVRARQGERVSDLCREFGISRKTAYKFLERYATLGAASMADQSRARHRQGRRISSDVEQMIVALKTEHRTWGAKKLKVVLGRKHVGVRLPACSTMNQILARHGLVVPRRRRRRVPPHIGGLSAADGPNRVWAVDYKGQFLLGDRSYCYPLTASDLYSRFLIGCEALGDTRLSMARAHFERLFGLYGLPDVIRSDNGVPFANARGLLGLTSLSAYWISLGIVHERIEPGHPEQNGAHERMHRTLKQDTTRPAARTLLGQQERFDRFVEIFNNERPHEAIGMKRPAELYVVSTRAAPPRPLEYPLHDDVRTISSSGHLTWGRRNRVFVARALAGHEIGMREVDDDLFLLSFAHLDLGWLDTRANRFSSTDRPPTPSADAEVSPM